MPERVPSAAGFEPGIEMSMVARTIGLLYLAGATIGLVSLLLPHSPAANDGALYSNIALAFATGAGVMALRRRMRPWMVHLVLTAGVLVIARAIYYSGEAVSFYSIWFIWIGLVAFYFMRRAVAASYVAFSSAVYALTLVNEPGSSPIARWLTTVATLVVAGVLISALVTRARRQAERMTRLAGMAHDLSRLSDPDAARRALCAAAKRLTGAAEVALFVAGEQDDRTFAPGWLHQPVTRDRAVVAVLAFRGPIDADAELLDLLAVETSVTLERLDLLRRLEASARTDELTGLLNRRAWEEALPREVSRAAREDAALCVAILDIDRFKSFNDAHGHPGGDLLLKEAAAAWSGHLRPTDVLARYGGDEFTLAMPGCTEQEANALVERLRAAVPAGTTCSAGIARWDGAEPAATLLERADRALYRAKDLGRDRGELAPV